MQIYSWNMWFKNRDPDGVLDFITKSDADIFCLQEVPQEFLPRLKSLPYHFAECVDVDRLFETPKRNHAVILSKYEVVDQGAVPFPDYWDKLPLRAKLWVKLLRPWSWSKVSNRNGLWADIQTPHGRMRVFCLHLILATVNMRLREFDLAMEKHDPALPTIICGDFNTIESRRVSLINWATGGSLRDILDVKRERQSLNERFKRFGLANPLTGNVTHPLSRSQLDHILVPQQWRIEKADVIFDRHGSDHHPISVTVDTSRA